jgi:predicted RNA-binding protein associated with RNAse of E/G family
METDLTQTLRKINIQSRLGLLPGWSDGSIALFDRFDDKADRVVRHFVLLEKSVKLMYEPWGWQDRWYIDLVEVRWQDAQTLTLEDLYLDVIVEGNGPTYRMIDLEDLASALGEGKINVQRLQEPLRRLQRFLDDHLHGGKDFPPAAIKSYMDLGL